MIELLVQKCVVSAPREFTRPGDIFRRIIECVASGLFLPGMIACIPSSSSCSILVLGGSGLLNPCEKGGMDAAGSLTAQERVDITVSAQVSCDIMALLSICHALFSSMLFD